MYLINTGINPGVNEIWILRISGFNRFSFGSGAKQADITKTRILASPYLCAENSRKRGDDHEVRRSRSFESGFAKGGNQRKPL